MKKTYLLLFSFLLIVITVKAQNLATQLKTAYAAFAKTDALKYGSVSFTVLDSKTGTLIFGEKENTGLATASTLKTITSATALELLGEDFTFKTEVFYSGEIVEGILNGDLIIKGGGDPTLGSERWDKTKKLQILNKILFSLQQKGIKIIKGNIIADASAWDTQSLPTGWIWQDIGNYYGAGTSALCWGENQFDLNFTPGKTLGSAVEIGDISKTYPFLKFVNEITTGKYGSGDNVYAYSAPYTNLIYLRGTYGIDLKKEIGLSLPEPSLAMAHDVSEFLKGNGYETKFIQSVRVPSNIKDVKPLLTITSPPLREIIYWFNKKSINLFGEQFIRTLGAKLGQNASTIEGLKVLKDFWKTKGIDPETLNIYDGSGLSPANRVNSLTMAKILAYANQQKWFKTYYDSFPLYNNQKMKSGTIANVLGYAGYAGQENNICFSLIINNYSGSAAQMRQKMYTLLNTLK
ncbi:D-alanyl-D-alanine carboxypeptidase/D-alanyl-D-alanine-endopeptidase [Pedobacter alpinus]|uniref:D-alanyl-D-alanine carboxypeptidase/D-alanyl-D-alanine-endopeptidase n=1 Tax=Pedobacter alpinus TaxID=1590643 RepID=A0ABW5TRR8_9SPHI